MPFESIGPYVVLESLGRGGMGEVLRCRDRRLDRQVALKVLGDTVTPVLQERFQREAQLLAMIQSPHVVVLHACETDERVGPYLVMECLEGEDLAARLEHGRAMEEPAVVEILHDIAEGLQAVHDVGLVHRDLKPANVMLCDGLVKLVDFGLAKKISPLGDDDETLVGDALTVAGQLLGTIDYMSPEQARGEPADSRSDLWAFGCIAYELFTGRKAFGAAQPTETLATILRGEPNLSLLDDVAAPHAQLVARCLSKDPQKRPQSAQEILDCLRSGMRREVLDSQSFESDVLVRARAAFDRREWDESLTAFREALPSELSGEDLETAAWAARWAADYDASGRFLADAERAYVAAGDMPKAARCAAILTIFHGERLRPAQSKGCLLRAQRYAETLEPCEELGFVTWAVCVGLATTPGESHKMMPFAEKTVALGRSLGSPSVEALGLTQMGHAALILGRHAEGVAYHDEAASLAVAGGLDPFSTGFAVCSVLTACRGRADWERAAELADFGSGWCEERSIGYFPGLCRAHRTEVLRFRGRYEQAEEEAHTALGQLIHASPYSTGMAKRELGEIAFRRGDYESARVWAMQAFEVGITPQPLLGLLALEAGDAAGALAGMKASLQDLFNEHRVHVLPVIVTAALALEDLDEAERAAEELQQIAEELSTPAPEAAHHEAHGEVLLARGQPADAASSLRSAHRLWSQLDAPYDAARALALLAQAQQACGDSSGAELSAKTALSLFEKLGAQAQIERVTQRLGALPG